MSEREQLREALASRLSMRSDVDAVLAVLDQQGWHRPAGPANFQEAECSHCGLRTTCSYVDEPGDGRWVCGDCGALREAARYEQVGFRQPGVAHGYEFHSYCSGEPQAPGRSIFYDHSHCVPLYRQVTEGGRT